MVIIDKTKPRPPKYVRKIHPLAYGTQNPRGMDYFKTQAAEKKYWEEVEFPKWLDGIRGADGEKIINGLYYFYLQEGTIYDIDTNKFLTPLWRDSDDILFDDLEFCIKNNLDYFVVKRRGYGFTSSMVCTGVNMILTHEGMEVPMTSADDGRTQRMINNNLIPMYSNLHNSYKPAIHKKALQKGEIIFAEDSHELVMRGGKLLKLDTREGSMSSLTIKPTTKNPRLFESVRTKFGFIDEAFLHNGIVELKSSMRLCFGAGLKKKGTLVLGGSSGNPDKNLDAMRACANMYYDSKKLGEKVSGMRTRFIPGWMGDFDYSVNGWTDEKRGTEEVLRQLDDLSKKQDKTEFMNFKHGMPLFEEDVFDVRISEVFPTEIIDVLNKQKTYILNNPNPIKVGRMEGTIEHPVFKVDPINGCIFIAKDPIRDLNYTNTCIGGSDPIPFEGEDEVVGSKFSTIIHERTSESPSAYFLQRSLDINFIVNQVTLLLAYYNNCQTLLELNRGGYFYNHMIAQGLKNFLAKCPAKCGMAKMTRNEVLGVRANAANNTLKLETLIFWLYNYAQNIPFIELVEQLLTYGTGEPDDLVDAFAWALVAHADWSSKQVKALEKTQVMEFRTVKMVNGKRVYTTVTQQL